MGYTHYHYQKQELPKDNWQAFISDVKEILKNPDVPLAWEYNETNKPPQVDEDVVRFNGHGREGHETFMLTRVLVRQSYLESLDERDEMAFGFCKTAHKPYDKYVTACLILAKIYFGSDIRISSDGSTADWNEGKELVDKLLNKSITLTEDSRGSFVVEISDAVEA